MSTVGPPEQEQAPPRGGGRATRNKNDGRTAFDPEEARRALRREARTAALAASAAVRRRHSTLPAVAVAAASAAAPQRRTLPAFSAADAAVAAAQAVAAGAGDPPSLGESHSFDSADRAIVRGSIMASRAAGEPPFDDMSSEGDGGTYCDVDLTSVAETTLPSVRTHSVAGGGGGGGVSAAPAPTAAPASARPTPPAGGGAARGGAAQGLTYTAAHGDRDRRERSLSVILENGPGAVASGKGPPRRQRAGGRDDGGELRFVDDEKEAAAALSGPAGPAKEERQRRRRRKKKKKKMAFPRSSILRIKVPKRRRSGEGDSFSSGSSSSSLWSWKKTKKKAKKKRRRGHYDDDRSHESTVLSRAREATEDAWMCGLCGAAFRGNDLAEAHEIRCIRYAFGTRGDNVRMGYLPTLDATMAAAAAAASNANETVEVRGGGGPLPPGGVANRGRFATDHGVSFLPPISGPATAPARPRANSDSVFRGGDGAPLVPAAPLTERVAGSVTANDGTATTATIGTTAAATRYEILTARTSSEPGAVHTSESMRRCVVMTDEAVCKVSHRAATLVLTSPEADAEMELALLARDREYYDALAVRAAARRRGRSGRPRGRLLSGDDGGGILGEVKSRFEEAYRLVKEDEADGLGGGAPLDVYAARGTKRDAAMPEIRHDDGTLYINVVVKNGAQVISNELERLAKMRWEQQQISEADRAATAAAGLGGPRREFEWFRQLAQYNMIRLAGLALASDFTPRRIAVQLSNDLYRLMGPRLKRKGVSIETEIEYRVGAYFVLGVNVAAIDWVMLMRHTHREVEERKRCWREERIKRELTEAAGAGAESLSSAAHPPNRDGDDKEGTGGGGGGKKRSRLAGWRRRILRLFYVPTTLELIAQCLAWLHHLHWIISVPTCKFWYHVVLRDTMRRYIIKANSDEIFQYVERKGMEMDLEVCDAARQASFMLNALRELRADERELKKKKAEAESGEAGGTILGPLLGPAIKEDKGGAAPPEGWAPPDNLEDVNFEMDLPVGFRRLRWALLSKDSTFELEAVWKVERQYENIVRGDWSEHGEHIGLPTLPANVSADSFIDVSKESEYLMPKSAFVKANMAYDKCSIVEYNDHCFAYQSTTRTPEVPYGNTFLCHTRVVITNRGNSKCRMVCSVEAEFPNGPPMIGRQIKSGMRAGTAESFVALGETVCRYADEYP